MTRGKVRKLEGKWVLLFEMESFANLSPINIVISRKVIWFLDISAMNLIVGWK